ncbi:MAG: 16S rRNA methyltransferase [Anaerolineae bacterium]|nr:16S rRNA methyltransferase [Anaerolineae bacterium]
MMGRSETVLDDLVRSIRLSPKYKYVAPEFIRSVGKIELTRRGNLKAAVKATKNKLHQIAGAYLPGRMAYDVWLRRLADATRSADPGVLRSTCVEIMHHHISTRERLPILDAFYATTLADLGPIHSVLDVACGLNPLAIPWMPLADRATYIAYDIYEDMVAFLSTFMGMVPVRGKAEVHDVLRYRPGEHVELALLLKTIPCLEQVDKEAGRRLLDAIDADHILVSFPAHSLGGRRKGMVAHYEESFYKLIEGRGYSVWRYEFASELAFLLSVR